MAFSSCSSGIGSAAIQDKATASGSQFEALGIGWGILEMPWAGRKGALARRSEPRLRASKAPFPHYPPATPWWAQRRGSLWGAGSTCRLCSVSFVGTFHRDTGETLLAPCY